MLKVICLELVLFAGLTACGDSRRESESSDNTATRESQASRVVYSKINQGQAKKLYRAYAKLVKNKEMAVSPCPTQKDTLKYMRIKKDEIGDHLGVVSDGDLPESTSSYASIRFYPCMSIPGENRFIIAYTEKLSGDRHKDKPDSYYLVTFSGTINWCELYNSPHGVGKRLLVGHNLCSPHCPDTDQSLPF